MKAAIKAADGVVLAMPMSPVNRHRIPPDTNSAATVAPMSSASHRLVARHGRTGGQVRGPVGHPGDEHPLQRRQRSGDPDVDDRHGDAVLAGEHVDRRPARGEVHDHLGRDLLGPRRHPLRMHAVIGREHGNGGRTR